MNDERKKSMFKWNFEPELIILKIRSGAQVLKMVCLILRNTLFSLTVAGRA